MPDSAEVELETVIRRIVATEASVNAYVEVDLDSARDEARRADRVELRSRPPLHGRVFGVKEVIGATGLAMSNSAGVLRGHTAENDATVVHRLRVAGATLVGNHVSHQLTCGLDEPPTRNPWSLACYPGGSTAGGGVSVSVGSAHFALGTDAAGSVRIPAAMTGVVGLKPSAGLVSSHGVTRLASAPSIDHVGVLARTVSEVAEVLAAVAGPDPCDAATLRTASHAGVKEAQQAGSTPLEGVRLGVWGDATGSAIAALVETEPGVESAVEEAIEELRRLGADVAPIEVSDVYKSTEAVVTLFAAELASAHADLLKERRDEYHSAVARMLDQALAIPVGRVREAVRFRTQLRHDISVASREAGIHALVGPTTPRVAMPLADFDPTEELGMLIPYTCPFNLTGFPAISVPCGFSNGLPVGLQIAGTAPFVESRLFQVASEFETSTPWHESTPSSI